MQPVVRRPERRSLVRCVVIALAVALGTSESRAQDSEPQRSQDEVLAEGLFREGRRAADAGDFDTACARFTESHRIDPALGTLLNIADCEELRGRVATAWRIYHEVQGKLDATDDRLVYVRARLQKLEPDLPRLAIVDRTQFAGLVITCDGTALGPASEAVALPVDPGPHVVVARTSDGREARTSVTLARGEAKKIVLEAKHFPKARTAAKPRTHPPDATRSGTRWTQRTSGLVMIVGGGLALATSAVTGALAIARSNEVENECDPEYNCSPAGVEAASSGSVFATLSTIAFVTGVAGVGGGVVLLWTAPATGPRPGAGLVAGVSGSW